MELPQLACCVPQFWSKADEDFANQWEFDHVTTSPYHSQSDGKAEAAVKIAKRLLKEVSKDHTDIHLAVLAHLLVVYILQKLQALIQLADFSNFLAITNINPMTLWFL